MRHVVKHSLRVLEWYDEEFHVHQAKRTSFCVDSVDIEGCYS